MAGGLGLLFSGLAGASKGLATGMEDERQTAERANLETLRSKLEEEKALRIAEAGRVATRQAGIQQGKDIDSATVQLQNERDASAINAANSGVEGGSNMTAADAAVLRDKPEARKAYGLLNPNRQSDLEDRATAAEKLGYLDAARETRGALQTEITNQRNQNIDENTKQAQKDEKEYRQQQADRADKRERREAGYQSSMLEFNKSRAKSLDAKEERAVEANERAATTSSMKGWETEAKDIQRQMASSDFQMQPPELQAAVKAELANAREKARELRTRLSGVGIEAGPGPDKPFNPADFRIGKPSGSAAPKAGGVTVPNPVQQDAAPASQASTKDMALRGIDTAINDTVRALAAAGNRGDKDEAARLNSLLQEQQAAKAKM